MKNPEAYLSEIKEIRQMMEQSSRFLSLSGLSGVLIGLYALIGAFVAYRMIYFHLSVITALSATAQVIVLSALILILSLVTVLWLTFLRAKKSGRKIWGPGPRAMCINLAVPLASGGVLILIFVFREIYSMVAPLCLIFYGLALVNAAKFTRQEIFYMGLLQIVFGTFAALFTEMGLLFWATGFGAIHIIYGTIMYLRYEQNTK
ncbi:MAG: hypothetical protein RBS73_00095 [Prolixibacteraceae bacterium]|jgi:hypothetical protein|nr:hypothetical protein [Prolixibacteraceae bacterium]